MIKIFIPAYNEEKFIGSNLTYLSSKFSELLKEDYIIYIVNDGSIDKTGQIIDDLKINNIVQFRCKGPTVRENVGKMMLKSCNKGDLLLLIDADLSTDIKAIPQLFKEINNGYDVVIGSRYVNGSRLRRTTYRFIVSKLFNFSLRVYFGSNIKDHECGFKLFKAKAIKDIVENMGWSFKRRGFWDSEFLIRASQKNYLIKEIPITWEEGPKSYISLKKEKSMIPYIFFLKFRLFKERKKN